MKNLNTPKKVLIYISIYRFIILFNILIKYLLYNKRYNIDI